jgi:autotransporter-associated beta strand protein
MTSSTWRTVGFDGVYENDNDWSLNKPGDSDTAFFGTSFITSISILAPDEKVGGWTFIPGALVYNFSIAGGDKISFSGAGITVNSGIVKIDIGGTVGFLNTSTAGEANITIEDGGILAFDDGSTAGSATIINNGGINGGIGVNGDSTLGNANITNNSKIIFGDNSSAGNATINNNAGGLINFSLSKGLAGDHKLTAGSIAGTGEYLLGRDELTVGSNGHSTEVSGPIDDGAAPVFSGGSLVKVGHDTLTLSFAGNAYSGGTTVEGGTLELGALGAGGTGDIIFKDGAKHNIETLMVENSALSGHVFGNNIDLFGKHTVLDLSGLKFHKGATAKYHPATDILDVHSGGVTDVFKLVSPLGTHFVAAKDGQGGTKVTLDPPHHTAALASLSTHDVAEQNWATDIAGSAGHLSDFLFTA